MIEKDIQALPGHCLLVMKNRYGDFDCDIYIPKSSKKIVGRMGMVVSVTTYPEHVMSMVFVGGKLKPRPMWLWNKMYVNLLEKHVLCKNATLVMGELYDVRLEFVQSVVPAEAMPSDDQLGRCRQCKSSGEANILLGPDGFCPNCGFNNDGLHESMDAINVTEEDIDHISRIPHELAHIRRTGGKALKNRVISYPGQGRRTANIVASPNELN